MAQMQDLFLIISNSLVIVGGVVYTVSILKRVARPHRMTRFVLLLITGISFASLLAQKNYTGAWLPGVSVTFSVLFFILSLKYGMGGWEKLDTICLSIALVGIILWKITDNPVLALYCAIGADFTGLFPTILKTYRFPHTESLMFFLLNGIAALFNLMATKGWAINNYLYPLYIILACLLMVLLIIRPKFSAKCRNRIF